MPKIKSGLRNYLEHIYHQYNNHDYVDTDPVMFLHTCEDSSAHELLGLFASSLAYGRVAQILKSIRKVLGCVSLSPVCLYELKDQQVMRLFAQFKHRFTTGEEVASLLLACKRIYKDHGSLYNCFLSHYKEADTTYVPALVGFIKEVKSCYRIKKISLLPDPEKKSACKRLHLFLRWMIRKDAIDPGPWQGLPASKLIIPLDTHMHRIGLSMGFTKRKQADIKTAMEITDRFKMINPDDPVKYDFALTRIGMSGKT